MARGLQKAESQKKAQEAAAKKAGGKSNLKDRSAAFKCMIAVVDYKTFTQHFEAKHPKDSLPAEDLILKHSKA